MGDAGGRSDRAHLTALTETPADLLIEIPQP
jgi:hypothetical protein